MLSYKCKYMQTENWQPCKQKRKSFVHQSPLKWLIGGSNLCIHLTSCFCCPPVVPFTLFKVQHRMLVLQRDTNLNPSHKCAKRQAIHTASPTSIYPHSLFKNTKPLSQIWAHTKILLLTLLLLAAWKIHPTLFQKQCLEDGAQHVGTDCS